MSNSPDDDRDRPLISARSPSYERARHERESPSASPDPMLVATLGRLCEAEYDAAHLCDVAAELLAPDGGAGADERPEAPHNLVRGLVAIHEHHRDALAATLVELGAAAPRLGDHARVLSCDPSDLRYGRSAPEIVAAVAAGEAELATYYQKAQRAHPDCGQVEHQLSEQHTELNKNQSRLDSLSVDGGKRF
ncbi:MAG: hypothetical protein Tsb0020_11310 [Haliangiales bacterium]